MKLQNLFVHCEESLKKLFSVDSSGSGFYIDGFGNRKDLPKSNIEQSIISNAVNKRIRKADRNLKINKWNI